MRSGFAIRWNGFPRLLNPAPLREGLGPSYDALRLCVSYGLTAALRVRHSQVPHALAAPPLPG